MLKFRLAAVAGGATLLGLVAMLPAQAVTSGTDCGVSTVLPTPPAGAVTAPIPANPTGSGQVYAGGDPTTGGAAGVEGTQGWLQASGSTTGGQVAGTTSDGALNGYANVGASPGACVGAGGQSVTAP